jgi:hypothetical protein
LLSANLGAGLNLAQNFNLSDSGLNAALSAGTSNQAIPGFDVNGTTLIQNVSTLGLGNGGTVPLSLDFSPNNPQLHNQTNIVPTATAGVTIGKVSIASIGNFTLFKTNITVPLGTINVFNTTFPAAFQSQTLSTQVA